MKTRVLFDDGDNQDFFYSGVVINSRTFQGLLRLSYDFQGLRFCVKFNDFSMTS